MASPNGQRTNLARVKDFFLAPILSCCGARKKPAQPIEIHPPKDFRRMEIRFDGLTPEQEAFLREKAFLDTLPPTPPLPILSPSAPGTATPPTPTTTTTNPFFTHSNISCYFDQQHHQHHDIRHNNNPTTHKNNTYTSCSAPHLSTSTTTTPTTGGIGAHQQYNYPPYSVPHLPGAAAIATSPLPTHHANTANINTSPSKRQSRRFSAINILRGSWNNSHPVSAEEAMMTESRGSSTHHLAATGATTPTPSPQYHRRVRKLRRLSGAAVAPAAASASYSEMDMEDRRRGKWGFVGQGLDWEKGGGGSLFEGGSDMRAVSGGRGTGGECEEAKSLKSLGRDSEVTLGGSACGCGAKE